MSTMNSKYVDILGDLLAKREYNKAKTLVLNSAYAPVIRDHCLEVTAVVGAHLNAGDVKWSRELEECCEFALLQVAQLANPKEALLGFLEQVESFDSSKKFKILLLPIQAVLLRMPTKRLSTLNWVLRALESHVRVLVLSKASNLEGQQRKLLDGDPNVQIIADIYEALIEFYRPLVNEVALRKQVSPEEAPARRSMLSNNLIRLMDKPLVFMDIHREPNEAPSLLYTSATKLVSYLCQLKGDLLSLLDEDLQYQRLTTLSYHKSESQEEPEKELEKASPLAKAMLFYLLYGEGLGRRHVPCVYHNLYVFHESLRWSLILLRNQKELVMYKGLLLLRESLVRLADLTVDSPCLEFSGHCTVSQELMNVMLYCNVQEFRELALHCFKSHVRKFSLAGRQKMLKMLLTMQLHPGVKAVIVNMVKENIHLCLDQNRDEFLQEPFHTLASLIFPLAEGAVTDLLKQYDDIMATINLTRYILLRDQDDRTGFKQIVPTFEQQFLEPLTSALQLSRAHYQLDLNLAKEGKPRDLEVTLNGLAPQLLLTQQKDVLEAAITSFDLMESLLGRVQELLAASK